MREWPRFAPDATQTANRNSKSKVKHLRQRDDAFLPTIANSEGLPLLNPCTIMSDANSHQKRWGTGDLTSAHHRRRLLDAAAPSRDDDNVDFDTNNDDGYSSDAHPGSDEDNPFESIGRALLGEDRGAGGAKSSEGGETTFQADNNAGIADDGNIASKNIGRLPMDRLRLSNNGSNVDMGADPMEPGQEEHDGNGGRRPNDEAPASRQHADANTLPRPPTVDASSSNQRSQQPARNENSTQPSRRRRESTSSSSVVKKSTTPPRFTFQSSAKPKRSTFKTPSDKSIPPSRTLFSSSIMSQKTSNKSTTQTKSSNTSTQKRKHRHTFRQSMDRSTSNTPATKNNNVRDLGFVPSFLSNAKGGGVNGASPHKDAPPEEDEQNDFDSQDDTSLFSRNIISGFQQQQRQTQRKSESSNAKSGILVQRLRSLRSTDQRMAMRLRSGQYSASGSSGADGGLMSMRKRRRSAGNGHLDVKNTASSILDVTVSGALLSGNTGSSNEFGDGRTLLPAYIHGYTTTKQPSGQGELKGVTFPCYSWIVMSQDVLREQGIVNEDGCTKQLRFYDAVVVPPRLASIHDQPAATSNEANRSNEMLHMPTIICTHVCQEYSAEEQLDNVSFDPFV